MEKFWNIPNTLGLLRMALVPVFVVTFFTLPSHLFYVALIVFIVASLTDVLDGIIARKTKTVTPYGIVLDPLADKCLKIAVFLSFGIAGVIPLWISIAMAGLDLTMIITGVFLYKRQIVIPSNILGKAGTFIVSCAIILCFFADYLNGWNRYLLYIGLIIVVSSFLVYFIANFKACWEKVFGKKKKHIDSSPQP